MIYDNNPQVVITIKGRSGTGKSTLATLIFNALTKEGIGGITVVDDNGEGGELEVTPNQMILERRVLAFKNMPRNIIVRTKRT